MKKTLIVIVLSAIICSCNENLKHAVPEDKGMNSEILSMCDSVMARGIEDGNFPGGVVCIVKDDAIVFQKAYGNKSVEPDIEPMTEDAIFDLASLSKCVGTSLSFLHLCEQGLVSLDDRVDKYIPDFRNWTDSTSGLEVPISIRHLMTHTSGLASYPNVTAFAARYGDNCPDSLMHHIATELPRLHAPGSDHIYSCPNFITVQNIIQTISGKRLCDYASEFIFKPLSLRHTMYLPTDESIPADIEPLLVATEIQEDGKALKGAVHDPVARRFNNGNSGNAGVFSNAEDLAVIACMLLNGGVWNGQRILSEESVKQLSSVPEGFEEFGRTIGWDKHSGAAKFIGKLSEDNCICHTGYTGTSMVLDFDKKIAIIILTNRVHPKDTGSLFSTRKAVSDIVFDSMSGQL